MNSENHGDTEDGQADDPAAHDQTDPAADQGADPNDQESGDPGGGDHGADASETDPSAADDFGKDDPE